jgi:Protein of unknown function (DUF2628)
MLFQLLFGLGRMQTYTVHEGPQPPSDRIDRAEALRFIKDGFAFPAFLAGPIWLLAHRLWLAAFGYAAVAILILAANEWLGLPDLAALAAFVGLHLLIGFEADSIERANLEQKGWSSIGSVSGTSALDCERRFFETWLPGQPILATRQAPHVTPAPLPQPLTPAGSGRGGAASAAGRLAALWRSK